MPHMQATRYWVALRKESVDRNCLRYRNRLPNIPVALRKESVDRNKQVDGGGTVGQGSLSARRAWIEITLLVYLALIRYVALRKESVDRNLCLVDMFKSSIGSLSARRAWIEIGQCPVYIVMQPCRSPQGERG